MPDFNDGSAEFVATSNSGYVEIRVKKYPNEMHAQVKNEMRSLAQAILESLAVDDAR